MNQGKLVALLGGDHSTPLGYFKALAEKHGEFGILQIDAHCDLRKSYENFGYSHASVMYNAISEIPEITKLLQVGVRDFGDAEWKIICESNYKIVTYLDKDLKERQFEGQTWKQIVDEIVQHLPQKVHLSFDVDGLDPKLCPKYRNTSSGGHGNRPGVLPLKSNTEIRKKTYRIRPRGSWGWRKQLGCKRGCAGTLAALQPARTE